MLGDVTRALSVVLLVALLACSGSRGKGAASKDRDDDPGEGQSAAAPGPPRNYEDEAGKDEFGAWRWKGKRNDCFYVVGNKCFTELDDACDAARCKKQKKTCETEGGGPATVRCE